MRQDHTTKLCNDKEKLHQSVEEPSMNELCENKNDKDNLEQGLSLEGIVNSEN